jgi:hypothetical protein
VWGKTTIVILAKTEAFIELLVAFDSMLQNGNGIERQKVTLHSVYEIIK